MKKEKKPKPAFQQTMQKTNAFAELLREQECKRKEQHSQWLKKLEEKKKMADEKIIVKK